MEFEWDENKNRSNQLKHGLSFETAVEIFDGRFRITEAAAIVDGEARQRTIARIDGVVVVLVVHVLRHREGIDVIRVISARRASRSERLRYDRANT